MPNSPIVTTRSGLLQGVTLAADPEARRQTDVHVYRNIPFAASTEGDGRFRAPQREAVWDGVRDATAFGSVAPQAPSPLEAMFGSGPLVTSEDCLNLNVWTPGCDDRARPVMVWIHGGGFVNGSGTTAWYDGTRFAANHDVVVVTLNYRLGAFGYLHLAGITDADPTLSSNCGLLDQVAALEWVRDGIVAFGGDPANVTIFGESAGAMSVGALLAVPAAEGLFHRAVLQSGAAINVTAAEAATRTAAAVLGELGLTVDEVGVKGLREVAADVLLKTSDEVGNRGLVDNGLPYQPIIDGPTLPVHPHDALRSGVSADVDVLIGTNRDEMRLFLLLDSSLDGATRERLADRARPVLGDRAGAVMDAYLANRPGQPMSEVWPDIATDMAFRWPAQRLAESKAAAAGKGRMWAYEFTWQTPVFGGRLKSCHALEIPFVFDNLDQQGAGMFTGDGGERQAIADVLNVAWANFARTGDPNVPTRIPHKGPQWPAFDPVTRSIYQVDATVTVASDPRGDELRLWPS